MGAQDYCTSTLNPGGVFSGVFVDRGLVERLAFILETTSVLLQITEFLVQASVDDLVGLIAQTLFSELIHLEAILERSINENKKLVLADRVDRSPSPPVDGERAFAVLNP